MRISDWSSDVCSSDLRVGTRRAEQLLPLVERGQAEGGDVGLEEAHRMRVEGRDDRGAAVILRMMHRAADDRLMPGVEAVEIAERDHPAAQRIGDAIVAVEADRGHVTNFPRRSEEHTSELQSLMRISYAVFCLKKKNKTGV